MPARPPRPPRTPPPPSRTRRDRRRRPPRHRRPPPPVAERARARAISSRLSLAWRALRRPRASAVEIGCVAEQVARVRERRVGLRRAANRPGRARARRCADGRPLTAAVPGRGRAPSRNTARHRPASRPAAERSRSPSCRVRRRSRVASMPQRLQRLADLGEIAADLHDRGAVGAFEPFDQRRRAATCPAATDSTSSPQVIGIAAAPQEPPMPVTPGHDRGREARLQPHEQMHERAVEQRIALAQQRDVAARSRRCAAMRSALSFVERGQRGAIVRIVERNFRRHGIVRAAVPRWRRQPAVDDLARVAAPSRLGEIGDDRRGLHHAHGLDRQQFGIAGPDADADRGGPSLIRVSLASALTAAAAIALPPLRPRTTIAGKPLAQQAPPSIPRRRRSRRACR